MEEGNQQFVFCFCVCNVYPIQLSLQLVRERSEFSIGKVIMC